MRNCPFTFGLKDGVGMRHLIAVLLLVLPTILSLSYLGDGLYDDIVRLVYDGGEESVLNFRANVLGEIIASAMAVLAFAVIYPKAASGNAKFAMWVLSLCELYMFLYYSYMFAHPVSRSAGVDIMGGMLLLLTIMLCCYGYSLMYSDKSLEPERRSWAIVIFMSYIMSFMAFFAPSWQRHIPYVEGNSRFMLDFSPLYVVFACLWNLLRCIALWKLFTSSLFVNGKTCGNGEKSSCSPLNRYLLAILVASFLVIKGLELVYKNTSVLLEF
jgi:hypothetical protein